MKILIAEDNAISRLVLERHLKSWGYEVVLAENGEQAWQAILQEQPQMVLLDWMMPEYDGIRLCQQVRANKDLPYIYLLMLTAKDQTEDMLAAFEAGIDDFVVKPFDRDLLRCRVAVGARILAYEDRLATGGKAGSCAQRQENTPCVVPMGNPVRIVQS